MKPAALAATRHALLARLRMVTAIATGAATKIMVRAIIGACLDIRTLRDAMLAIAIAALVMVREMAGALTATPGNISTTDISATTATSAQEMAIAPQAIAMEPSHITPLREWRARVAAPRARHARQGRSAKLFQGTTEMATALAAWLASILIRVNIPATLTAKIAQRTRTAHQTCIVTCGLVLNTLVSVAQHHVRVAQAALANDHVRHVHRHCVLL